jgi:ATP-binding cassette subfamily B multidrug efflux pump
MIKILKYLSKKDIFALILSLGFIFLQVWLDLTIPDYMSEITRLVQTAGSQMSDILIAGGKMLACAFGSLVAASIVSILSSKVGTSFSARLREKVYEQVQRFSLQEMSEFSTASLITRTTNDITQIQNFMIMGLQVLFKAPIMAVWAIIKILNKSWQWSVATGVAVFLLAAVVIICIGIAIPQNKKIQTLTDNLNRVTRENLTGLKVVRAYNAENYQENKFDKSNEDLTKANTIANKALAFMSPTIQSTMNGLTLAIYWIGAILINNAAEASKLSLFSDMIVFSSYAIQVVMAFMMLVMAFIQLPRAFVSAKRINEVLDKAISIADGVGAITDPSKEGDIVFNDVSFSYPGAAEPSLRTFPLKLKKDKR